MTKNRPTHTKTKIFGTFIILGIIGALFLAGCETKNVSQTPKSDFEIPKGRQVYFIQNSHNSPQMYEAIIDPVDVKPGDVQAMSVKVKDNVAKITAVIANVETDNGIEKYELQLEAGTLSDGLWKAKWTVHDTHSETYRTTFIAENTLGEKSEVTLTWTDSCTAPFGGQWDITSANTPDAACFISGSDGADNGDIVVNKAGFTLNINSNANLVFNPGNKIQLTAGSIAVSATAQIKQAYLCAIDMDEDGLAKSSVSTQFTDSSNTCSSITGGRRRKDIAGFSDGNDKIATYTVDSTGDVGKFNSIDAKDENTVAISYFDATNNRLKIAKSTDRGKTWNKMTVATTYAGNYNSLKFKSDGSIVASYNHNNQLSSQPLARTEIPADFSAGTIFENLASNTVSLLVDVLSDGTPLTLFQNLGTIYAKRGSESGTITVGSFAGNTFGFDVVDGSQTAFAVYAGNNFYVRSMKSTDGGRTWTQLPDIEPYSTTFSPTSISLKAIDANNVFALYTTTTQESGYRTQRLKFSKYNGVSWSSPVTITSYNSDYPMYAAVDALDSNKIYVGYASENSGYRINFAESTNGGSSWKIYPLAITSGGTSYHTLYKPLSLKVASGTGRNIAYLSYYVTSTTDISVAKLMLTPCTDTDNDMYGEGCLMGDDCCDTNPGAH